MSSHFDDIFFKDLIKWQTNFPKRDLKQHDRMRLVQHPPPNIRNVFGWHGGFPTWKGGCFTHFEASKRGQQGTGSGTSEKGQASRFMIRLLSIILGVGDIT